MKGVKFKIDNSKFSIKDTNRDLKDIFFKQFFALINNINLMYGRMKLVEQ